MWKATFAWHLEDMDLYSVNYIHCGGAKQWYVIPPKEKERFERVCQCISLSLSILLQPNFKAIFGTDYKSCPEFMRHKQYILSPTVLSNSGVPYNSVVQNVGEYIITFPYAYHAGY